MRKFTMFLAAVGVLFAGNAYAADKQLDADDWRCPTNGPDAARTDGLCYDPDQTWSPAFMSNGYVSLLEGSGAYRYVFSEGASKGQFCEDAATIGTRADCAGNTTLVQCACTFGNGLKLNHFPIVTATIDPVMTATGFNIGSDQVSNDGIAIYGSVAGASGHPFVVGTDQFYFCMELNVDDVSGIDASFAGFVALFDGVAWNADSEAYTDYAGIGIEGTAASGLTEEDVYITTEIDAAGDGTGDGVVETDTTDSATDETTHKYCTYVTSAGVTTFTFDGAAPTTTATYTFRDGLVVVPFFSYLHTADLAGAVDIVSWEVGYW